MIFPRLSHLVPVFLIFFLLSGPVHAGVETDTPSSTVQRLLENIKQIQEGDNLTPEQTALNNKLSDEAILYLDVQQVSEKTLGKHWKKRTDQERKDFILLLGELFKHVAFPNSSKFFSELKLHYSEDVVADSKATVPLKVVHEDEGEVNIDFVLRQNSSAWKVVDVILDGVSMRNNLRTQFYRILKKKDYPELVRRMMKKLKAAKG